MKETTRKIIITGALIPLFLTGCTTVSAQLTPVPRTLYQKVQYKTVTVMKGDMEPVLELKLKARPADQVDYRIDISDAEVEEVYVNAGEHVTKGQLMVSFLSEKTKESIEEYSSEVKEKQLLLEHYRRLSLYDLQERDYLVKEKKEYPLFEQQEDEIKADQDREDKMRKYVDYTLTLEQLEEDVRVASLFLEEERAKLDSCQLKAEDDGVITYLNKGLLSGYVEPGGLLITETCGENTYEAYTDEDYDFRVGDHFNAEKSGLIYDMKVSEVIPEDSGGRTVVFEPDETLLNPPEGDSLNMTIKKAAMHGVVYVDREAVQNKDGKEFVYTLTPDGYLQPVCVQTGEIVENMIVIKSGLSGGEEVALIK